MYIVAGKGILLGSMKITMLDLLIVELGVVTVVVQRSENYFVLGNVIMYICQC